MKKTCHHVALKLLFALMLMFSFSMIGFGQTVKTDKTAVLNVSEKIMQQVVRGVLIGTFTPQNEPSVVYLYEKRTKKSWLPKIKNIEFRLLSDEEFEQRTEGAFFFTEPELLEGKYKIGFVFGRKCGAGGNSWYFRISKQKLKLWKGEIYRLGCMPAQATD